MSVLPCRLDTQRMLCTSRSSLARALTARPIRPLVVRAQPCRRAAWRPRLFHMIVHALSFAGSRRSAQGQASWKRGCDLTGVPLDPCPCRVTALCDNIPWLRLLFTNRRRTNYFASGALYRLRAAFHRRSGGQRGRQSGGAGRASELSRRECEVFQLLQIVQILQLAL